jgi:hypothetical protein
LGAVTTANRGRRGPYRKTHQRRSYGSLRWLENGFCWDLTDRAQAARTLGLEVTTLEIRRAEDIAPAFDALKGRGEALYVCTDALANTNRIRINILAVGARLLTMHGSRDYVEAGGLMSFGPNFPELFRRAADYVDKILRGAKPGSRDPLCRHQARGSAIAEALKSSTASHLLIGAAKSSQATSSPSMPK